MSFPKVFKDQKSKVETKQTGHGYVTYITNLDGSIETFRSEPVPTETQAEGNHTFYVEKVMEGTMGYFETVVDDGA